MPLWIIICFNTAMMLLDDVVRDGKSKTCAGVFACHERLKNSRQDFKVYAWTRIFYGKKNFTLKRQVTGKNREVAAWFHHFNGIEEKIQYDLSDLVGQA